MRNISLKANAKLNLFLKINKKNSNGYHDMIMINQSVSLYDKIRISKNYNKGIRIINGISNLEQENNTIYKAAKIINDGLKLLNIDIHLTKKIPVQAGLGGGSSDAAAVIIGIDRLYNLNINKKQMIDIALKIGADVPFCLFGGSKYIEGIGEKISDIISDKFLFIIIKPDENMPTNKAFNLYDASNHISLNTEFLKNIKNKSQKLGLSSIKNYFYNDFENVIIREIPIIEDIKNDFYKLGADYSMMSGSGSTVYAIYNNDDTRLKAYNILKNKYPNIFLAQSTDFSIEYDLD